MLSRIANVPNAVYRWAVNTLENGDLVPLLVLVSAFHYAHILKGYDEPYVAVALGTLVDLGHYRSVLIASRYNGSKRLERVSRWAVAIVMTVVALSYHMRFYDGDIALALPMPILIFSLAYFRLKDGGHAAQAVARHLYDALQEKYNAAKERITKLERLASRVQVLQNTVKELQDERKGLLEQIDELARSASDGAEMKVKFAQMQDEFAALQAKARAFDAMGEKAQAAAMKLAGEYDTLAEAASAVGVSESTMSRLAKKLEE